MNTCPCCHATTRQNRAGTTESGLQRYRCMHCQRKYTPTPKQLVYPERVRRRALEMYVDGNNLRRIACHLKVNHQSVATWVKQHARALPATLAPDKVQVAELDELFTFIGP